MTPAEAEALGRRWIAAGGGWREGMRATCYADWGTVTRVFTDDDGTQTVYVSWDHDAASGDLRDYGADAWPDFRDPATRGVALEVIRERYLDGFAHIAFADGQWCLRVLPNGAMFTPFRHDRLLDFRGATEGEVLVMALEAATT